MVSCYVLWEEMKTIKSTQLLGQLFVLKTRKLEMFIELLIDDLNMGFDQGFIVIPDQHKVWFVYT